MRKSSPEATALAKRAAKYVNAATGFSEIDPVWEMLTRHLTAFARREVERERRRARENEASRTAALEKADEKMIEYARRNHP